MESEGSWSHRTGILIKGRLGSGGHVHRMNVNTKAESRMCFHSQEAPKMTREPQN